MFKLPITSFFFSSKSKLFISLLFFLFLFKSTLYSQKKGDVYRYARQVVDTLASPSMHGRGYVENGDKIAAKYLEDQFQLFGLHSFGGTFKQNFRLDVNTFPGKMEIEISRDEDPGLGNRVLVDPSCPGIKGKFRIIKADSITIRSDEDLLALKMKMSRHCFLYVDTSGIKNKAEKNRIISLILHPPKGIAGIIQQRSYIRSGPGHDPGPWDVASGQSKLPLIFSGWSLTDEKVDYVRLDVEAKLIHNYLTQNLIGYIPGTQYPDSFIVFTAHYDHLGEMGKECYFPGANDNASGCALLLNLAKYYSMPEHKPRCSVAFMAFGAEEAGLLGSRYYTEHPLFPLRQIKFLVNMDIMGTGDEGITVVNGTLFPDEFKTLESLNEKGKFLSEVKVRGKAANSDHYFFSEKGVKAFFIYTRGGIKAYHDVFDKRETLPLDHIENVFQLLTGFETWEEEKK